MTSLLLQFNTCWSFSDVYLILALKSIKDSRPYHEKICLNLALSILHPFILKLYFVFTYWAFNNHMDKKGGYVGGQPNVHNCPSEVGRWFIQYPGGHFSTFKLKYLVGSSPLVLHESKLQYLFFPTPSFPPSRYILSILGGVVVSF